MNREFFVNIIFLVLINLLVKPFFIFGIDLTVQNRVGDAYGLYFALFNFTYLFQILNDFGIQNFNNRHVSRHPQLLPKYFPNLLALKMLLSALYMVLAMLAGWLAGYGFRALGLLLILLVNQVLVQLIFFLRSNLSGLGFYRLDSFLSSLDKLLMLLTCGVVLWANPLPIPFSIELFAAAQTAALVLTGIIVFAVLRHKAPLSLRPSWAANWRAGRPALLSLFRQSLPYALVILLMTAYSRIDAVLLERLLPDGQFHADVYAGGYRLLDACNMLGYLFASLLLPMFARMLKQGDPVRPLVSLSFKLIWAGSITLAAAVFFARTDLIEQMMGARASAYRAATLGVLIWSFVPVCATYIFSTLLTADERLMQMNRYFVAGLVLDVALNIWLIPHWQAFGAAIATLATQTFIAGAMIWLCARFYHFRPSGLGVVQVVGFAGTVMALDWVIFNQTNWTWSVQFAAALAAGGLCLIPYGSLQIFLKK